VSRKVTDLSPAVRVKCLSFLDRCQLLGCPVRVVQTLRTLEEQEAVYQKGRTRPGEPCHHWLPPRVRPVGSCRVHPLGATVTKAKPGESAHNYGLAFDVAFETDGGGVSWEGPWDTVGGLGEHFGLEWGGRWTTPDRPHFQLPNWKDYIDV
jgi:peptidoglycan LD-endopeptidase CwlK